MNTRFSKPTCGIIVERQGRFIQKNAHLVEKCASSVTALLSAPLRMACPLCTLSVSNNPSFMHRGVPYLECVTCGHIFCAHDASFVLNTKPHYEEVYPRLSDAEKLQRQKDIYEPKLQWILEVMQHKLGMLPSAECSLCWLELGCGEGLFLKALKEHGIQRFRGVDADAGMVERAALEVGAEYVKKIHGELEFMLHGVAPDVIVAWYVFEHIFSLDILAKKLSQLPAGTLLCFSVPMFSMASIFDTVFEESYPRTLDNMVHSQLFTDSSIQYFLQQAEFTMEAQWIFGQDASDLFRYIQMQLSRVYSPELLHKVLKNCNAMVNELQSVMDKAFFADSRHIIAVKK